MSKTWSIRLAEVGDAEALVEYNARLAQETEGKTLDRAKLTAGVQAVFLDGKKGQYVVAVDGGKVVGQLMVTFEWSDWRNGNIWWLQSVYVEAAYRRRGVFRDLMDYVHQLQQTSPDAIGLRLYVEHHNESAQNTYLRLGFQQSGYQVMERLPADS